jgi:hypothetical protein
VAETGLPGETNDEPRDERFEGSGGDIWIGEVSEESKRGEGVGGDAVREESDTEELDDEDGAACDGDSGGLEPGLGADSIVGRG